MRQRSNLGRIPFAWLGLGPVALIAILPLPLQDQSPRVAGLPVPHPPSPASLRLPEAPPSHPPAAPCGGCESGCGAGPSGILVWSSP